jgi:DNA polymerase elongation subunit (family B)
MSSEACSQLIPYEKVKEYVNANVPIVPLKVNGNPHTHYLYENDAEQTTLANNLSEAIKKHVYSGDHILPLKLLTQQIPRIFWADERINRQQWYGVGCKTGLTAIPAQSDPNKVLLIVAIDADDQKTRLIIEKLVKQYGLLENTLVQNTPHGGMHVVFAVAVDPNNFEEVKSWENKSLGLGPCKNCKIEIKTQNMQITLDPSKHRVDGKPYTHISKVIAISEYPMFYDVLIKALKENDCLIHTPEEYHAIKEKQAQTDSNSNKSFKRDAERFDLTENEIGNCIDIILGRDEANRKENYPFDSIYVVGFRNDVAMSLSGFFYWSYITQVSTEIVIRKIAEESNNDGSADINKAISNASTAYRRGDNGQPVRGKSGLIEAFTRAHRDKNESLAKQRLVKLGESLRVRYKKPQQTASERKENKENKPRQSDIIVQLAHRHIPLFFKNQFKEHCAVVKVNTHYEVVNLDDQRFSAALRHLWIEENIAKNRPQITTIGEDQLKRAKDTLVSEIEHSKVPKITTHLRVAWGPKKDEAGKETSSIHYDLVNDEWQQVEISGSEDGNKNGFRIINSDTMVKEIQQWKESNYNPDKAPILFRRYEVNDAQVEPVMEFEPNIFDDFICNLTNVTGNKAAEMAKRYAQHFRTEASIDEATKALLAKVDICIKFIPEISKFVNNIIGMEGTMKTTYLERIKSLVDPVPGGKLNAPRIQLREIEQLFAHSYFVAFDNVGELSYDLSNFICAVATGTSVQFRKLYTSQGIVQLVIKCCVAFTSVNRAFIQSDAVRRLLNMQFLAIDDDLNYGDEMELRNRFETTIKPQLLGYIFSIISKAIIIKGAIRGKYSLKSMAAAEEWGEVISQAMGYAPGSFIDAYEKLSTIQKSQTLEFNSLVILYQKLYYDTFKPDNNREENFAANDDQIIKQGFKAFTFPEIYQLLSDYAESEGISTLKENKQWPRNNRELKDRTLAISIQLLNARGFSVDIRVNPTRNETIYILGTKEGLERYRAEEPTAVRECALILEQYPNLVMKFEDLTRSASKNDTHLSIYLDGKFKLRESRKNLALLENLLKHPNIKQTSDNPVTLEWQAPQLKPRPQQNDDKHNIEQSTSHSVAEIDHFPKNIFAADENNFGESTARKIDRPQKIIFEKPPKSATECIEESSIGEIAPTNIDKIVTTNSTIKLVQQLQEPLQLFHPAQVPSILLEQVPELHKFACFDCEWYREDLRENNNKGQAGKIYTFCLVDNQGENVKLHIDQFDGDRYTFTSAILNAIERYDSLAGFAIFSGKDFASDIDHIKINCEKVGLSQRFSSIRSKIKFIDLHKIFSNNIVKGFLKAADRVVYREESLDAVAQAYIGQGKPGGVSGSNAEFLQPNEQLEYCLQDALLCYQLVQKKDFELLQILCEISCKIKQSLFDTCNTGYSTEWWRSKLASIDYLKVPSHVKQWIDENMTYNDRKRPQKKTGVRYLGGYVIAPKMGRYLNAVSYDVSSMYPTMANIHNISSETINCSCCKDNMEARVPDQVMRDINEYLGDAKRPWQYWICQKKRGQFAQVMKDLVECKIQYKEAGLKLKEKAVKILANSGYGCFGNAYFEYQDPRVAELITAFGQYTLKSLVNLVGEDKVLYGDTDSIYLVGANDSIIEEAKSRFKIRLEVDKVWKILFLTSNKKQYLGLTEQGELVHTTLTGMKSNQPSYYNEVVQKLINKEFLETFIDRSDEEALGNIMEYIRTAFLELGRESNLNRLSFSLESKEPLYVHENNNIQSQIYNEILEDCNGDTDLAKCKSQAGRVYRYWKVTAKKKSVTIHPEKHQLDMEKYKQGLFICIRPELEVYGMSEIEINNLDAELVTGK